MKGKPCPYKVTLCQEVSCQECAIYLNRNKKNGGTGDEKMIKIKKSSNADSRTATEKVSKEVLLDNSRQHINDVIKAMCWMAKTMLDIANNHDWTKIENIDEFYHDFKQSQDGFQGDFKKEHWYKDLHLRERHHLNDRVPEDVNLFDVLERVADVTMAGLARSGNIYLEAISPEMLVRAYNNTIELLKREIEIEK